MKVSNRTSRFQGLLITTIFMSTVNKISLKPVMKSIVRDDHQTYLQSCQQPWRATQIPSLLTKGYVLNPSKWIISNNGKAKLIWPRQLEKDIASICNMPEHNLKFNEVNDIWLCTLRLTFNLFSHILISLVVVICIWYSGRSSTFGVLELHIVLCVLGVSKTE